MLFKNVVEVLTLVPTPQIKGFVSERIRSR